MSDADEVLRIAPLPPPIGIPVDADGPEVRFFRFVQGQFDRHDEIEVERRHAEAARRVQYEAERQEHARAMTAQAQKLEQVAEFVSTLTDKVAELAGVLDHVRGEVLAVQAKQAGLGSKLDTLTTRLDSALTELGRVAGKVDGQAADLHELRLRLDALEDELAGIKRQIDAYTAHAPTSRPPATDPSACVDPLEPGGES